ncbi:cytochrome b5 [Anabrus simplex]|uniref:cytochrome b5 n=1 Tax=Anabrus simplex TaxID=316456 RepID=UPI0034DD9D2B
MADTGNTTTDVKLFSREEVSKKNDCKRAWIVIHNSVYDVTDFLNEHPGGEEVLLEQAGKDGSEAFEDVGHSTDARDLMKKYKIGEVIPADRIETQEKPTLNWSSDKDEANGGSWKSWVIPVALGVFATLLYRFYFLSQGH